MPDIGAAPKNESADQKCLAGVGSTSCYSVRSASKRDGVSSASKRDGDAAYASRARRAASRDAARRARDAPRKDICYEEELWDV